MTHPIPDHWHGTWQQFIQKASGLYVDETPITNLDSDKKLRTEPIIAITYDSGAIGYYARGRVIDCLFFKKLTFRNFCISNNQRIHLQKKKIVLIEDKPSKFGKPIFVRIFKNVYDWIIAPAKIDKPI